MSLADNVAQTEKAYYNFEIDRIKKIAEESEAENVSLKSKM